MVELDTAMRLAALGQATRLSMCRRISEAGGTGLRPSVLAEAEGIPANLVSHHLRPLVAAGLLTAERVGREVVYRVVPSALAEAAGDLLDMGMKASS